MSTSQRQRLLSAITGFRKKRILVVGDLMLDSYVEGPPRFVSPEAPVVVIRVAEKYYKLGGAANTAENIISLGARVLLAGVIGNHKAHDDVGKIFLQAIRRSGITTSGIVTDPRRPTTLKMRVVSNGQQIVRIDEEQVKPIQGEIQAKLVAYVLKSLPSVDAVLVSDYNKGVITPTLMRKLIRAAKKLGKPIIVDPRPDHRDLYRGVTMITPNEHELVQMFGQTEINDSTILAQSRKLQQDLQIKNIMLTRGAKGLVFLDEQGKIVHVPALATQVVDVSGAGDTVASLAVLTINDLEPKDIAYLTSLGAKISVSHRRTTAVRTNDLIAEVRS